VEIDYFNAMLLTQIFIDVIGSHEAAPGGHVKVEDGFEGAHSRSDVPPQTRQRLALTRFFIVRIDLDDHEAMLLGIRTERRLPDSTVFAAFAEVKHSTAWRSVLINMRHE